MAKIERVVKIWCLYLTLLVLTVPLYAQQYLADSSVAKEEVIRQIPVEYINKARQELVIAYQHTSHGTHVSRGVSNRFLASPVIRRKVMQNSALSPPEFIRE